MLIKSVDVDVPENQDMNLVSTEESVMGKLQLSWNNIRIGHLEIVRKQREKWTTKSPKKASSHSDSNSSHEYY